MTTKPKSVLAWAVFRDGDLLPWTCSFGRTFPRTFASIERNRCKVGRVRITVVRERKKRRECKCTLSQRLVGDGCDVCNREPKVWKRKATKRRAKR